MHRAHAIRVDGRCVTDITDRSLVLERIRDEFDWHPDRPVSLIVLEAVIMSWLPIGQRDGLVVILQRLTEPALAPIVGSCHRWAVSIVADGAAGRTSSPEARVVTIRRAMLRS
jgi:hypothetical protein